MGQLIAGEWQTDDGKRATDGHFVRKASSFRNWIRADGSTPYTPDPDRYHLYIANACPWAHRTVIFRRLKKLESVISLSIVDPFMGDEGWFFGDDPDGTRDDLHGSRALHELYTRAQPDYTGRVTVPLLWDRKTDTAVNNESSEIIRMLNREFDALGDASIDFYPEALRPEIDAINERIYETVNNGVYRCGFATTQEAYEEAFRDLFGTLDELEARLGKQRYLVGNTITEADWRLFPTLVRFDAVYVTHFKCNRQRVADFPHLSGYLRELYQVPGIAETVHFDHIKRHYFESHDTINPTRIVPVGPRLNLDAPHGRDAL